LAMERGQVDPRIVLGLNTATAAEPTPTGDHHDHDHHDHSHVEVVGGSVRLEVPLTRQQLELSLPAFVQAHRVIRLKGRIWLEGKHLPLQLQMVGPRLDSWFEASPEQAWRPATGVGVDLVLIGFDPAAADQLSAQLLALSTTNGSSPA